MPTEEELNNAIAETFSFFLESTGFKKLLSSAAGNFVVSDLNQKTLYRLANKKEPLTEDELSAVAYIMGSGSGKLNPFEGDTADWSDDMVQEYADNLRNFLYTYKAEAKSIDPTIDTEEMHRGPMAQDIEKVAPDCVKETSDGTKVVDGNRLALVNAGVIGELSRHVIELEDKLNVR